MVAVGGVLKGARRRSLESRRRLQDRPGMDSNCTDPVKSTMGKERRDEERRKAAMLW